MRTASLFKNDRICKIFGAFIIITVTESISDGLRAKSFKIKKNGYFTKLV